jgi:hypothetical protein
MSKNYPCKDNLWAHCGALGEALRRASEAERKVEELEKANKRVKKVLEVAVDMLMRYEPPDSRCVSDMAVALASIAVDCENEEANKMLDEAIKKLES